MKYYSIGEFAELIGKTLQTLRAWHKKRNFYSTSKTKKMIKELLEDDKGD